MKIELKDSTEQFANERRLTRIHGDSKQVVLWNDIGIVAQGEVVDESFGGIGLQFDSSFRFVTGQEFEVSYNGVSVWAVVRHVTESDAGYRVGFEWKAACFSRAARQATNDASDAIELANFKEALPGGLYMMWRLLECEEWYQLGEKADRLRRLASRCEFAETVNNHVRQLQESLQLADPRNASREALQSLIEACIQVTGGSCAELPPTPVANTRPPAQSN